MELNEYTKFILGMPAFKCAKFAAVLRSKGHEIPERCEDEQAHVIHWMYGLYEQHGSDWFDYAKAYVNGA